MAREGVDNMQQPRPKDSWDFAGMQKQTLMNLAASHLRSYRVARATPRTSDRVRDSLNELVPQEELEQFMMAQSALKNKLLLRIVERRDLLMSIVSTALLFVSILLFAAMQAIQLENYNSKIADHFYTEKYMAYRRMEQNLFLVYIGVTAGYLVTFSLSVRWKLEMDADIKLGAKRRKKLFHFSKGPEPKDEESKDETQL